MNSLIHQPLFIEASMKFFRENWGFTFACGVLLFLLPACNPQTKETSGIGNIPTPPFYPSYPSEAALGQPTGTNLVSVSGWFTIIYNGEPHYYLNEESGEKSQLFFDAASLESIGGALQFDRKKVSLRGELTSANPRMIYVRTIHIKE